MEFRELSLGTVMSILKGTGRWQQVNGLLGPIRELSICW